MDELEKKLKLLGINREKYSFSEEEINDKYYLIKNNTFIPFKWQFYLIENNQKILLKYFVNKKEAYEFFILFFTRYLNESKHWIFRRLTCEDKEDKIDGLNIWNSEWIDIKEDAFVRDPLYSKPFLFKVFKIENKNNALIFAAGEFSNGVWGIYTKDLNKTINSN